MYGADDYTELPKRRVVEVCKPVLEAVSAVLTLP
jgi:hypothetical protein